MSWPGKAGRVLLWALALGLAVYSVWLAVSGNGNLGNVLVWLLAAAALAGAVFQKPLAQWFSHGAGRVVFWVLCVGAAVYALLLAGIVAAGYADRADGGEKTVIVLGAGLRGDTPSRLLRRRLDAAYDFAAAHPGALVITTGGQGRGETVPEGQAMRDYLIAKGLDPARVLAECKSTSTEENFAFAREILAARGVDPAAPAVYVTNAFHCYRAGQYAARAGFANARALPASTPASAVLPCCLREGLAVLYYWVFRRVDGGPLQGAVGLLAFGKRYLDR